MVDTPTDEMFLEVYNDCRPAELAKRYGFVGAIYGDKKYIPMTDSDYFYEETQIVLLTSEAQGWSAIIEDDSWEGAGIKKDSIKRVNRVRRDHYEWI